MTNSPYIRARLAQAALEVAPPLIRNSLLEKSEFNEEYSLITDAVIEFGDSGVSIKRSEFFDSIRKIFSTVSKVEVTDTNGQKWKLSTESKKGKPSTFAISRDKRHLPLPDFSVLSPDSTIRLRSLDETTYNLNLPASTRDVWRNILSERALRDDEVGVLHSDYHHTPVYREHLIRDEIKQQRDSALSLVPSSRRYFERLVGTYDGSASISDYAAGPGRKFFEQLTTWKPYDGFLFSLFLSSHSALTLEIDVEHIRNEDLVRAFNFLEKNGDRISQLGAIEIGLRILPKRTDIEPILIRLIEQIRDDDVDGETSQFKLISALFTYVDGELSRLRMFSKEPPFYRRLASLSQSALIHRQFVNLDMNIDPFYKWALNKCGGVYYLQSLADMRLEPRWSPDLAIVSKMKANFFGRIILAANQYKENINNSKLHDLVLGDGPKSIHSLSEFDYLYLPGPLEGSENSLNSLPVEISEVIQEQLNTNELGPSSFIALVNSASIFRLKSEQVELAAKTLNLGRHRLTNIEDKSQLLTTLHGLATVSAVSRSHTLADELKILVRRYRRDDRYALSIEEAAIICLIAAASRADLNDWKAFVGDWLTELAFGKLSVNDGHVLHFFLQHLCHVVPDLWVSCGKADAALRSLNAP